MQYYARINSSNFSPYSSIPPNKGGLKGWGLCIYFRSLATRLRSWSSDDKDGKRNVELIRYAGHLPIQESRTLFALYFWHRFSSWIQKSPLAPAHSSKVHLFITLLIPFPACFNDPVPLFSDFPFSSSFLCTSSCSCFYSKNELQEKIKLTRNLWFLIGPRGWPSLEFKFWIKTIYKFSDYITDRKVL